MGRHPFRRWEAIAAGAIVAAMAVGLVAVEVRRPGRERIALARATAYLDTVAAELHAELEAWRNGMLADGRWTATLVGSVSGTGLTRSARDLVRGQMPTARIWLVGPDDRPLGDPGGDPLTERHLELVRLSRTGGTTILGASELRGTELRLALASPIEGAAIPLIAVLDLSAAGRLTRRVPRLEWDGRPGKVALGFGFGVGVVTAEWTGGAEAPRVTRSDRPEPFDGARYLVAGGSLPDSMPSFALALERAAVVASVDREIRQERSTLLLGGLSLALVVAGAAWLGRNRRLREAERQAALLRLRAAEAEGVAARAGLAAVQARMHPHFLSNALHSLSALIGRDPAAAEEAMDRLGDLFRYSLEQSERDTVPLEEEWRFVTDYLAIEALRLGDRLAVRLEMDPSLARVPVPPFTIQPLVENAIRHGIAAGRGGGTVRVLARREGDRLVIEVADDGLGARPEQLSNGGTGLRTLRERLARDAEMPGSLQIETAPGAGCRIRVTLHRSEIAAGT